MIAVGSVTSPFAHNLKQIQCHWLGWELQTDPRWNLFYLSDGEWEWRDRAAPCDIDFGPQVKFIEYPERRKAWGAFCRKDWLNSLDTEKYPYVWMMCADDAVCPKAVEMILKEFEADPELMGVGFGASHHHYSYQNLPLGVYPSVNHADWINIVWRSELAKKVGVNSPEEYACDGIYHSEIFSSIQHDESKIKILPNILVFKN